VVAAYPVAASVAVAATLSSTFSGIDRS